MDVVAGVEGIFGGIDALRPRIRGGRRVSMRSISERVTLGELEELRSGKRAAFGGEEMADAVFFFVEGRWWIRFALSGW